MKRKAAQIEEGEEEGIRLFASHPTRGAPGKHPSHRKEQLKLEGAIELSDSSRHWKHHQAQTPACNHAQHPDWC